MVYIADEVTEKVLPVQEGKVTERVLSVVVEEKATEKVLPVHEEKKR